MSKSIIVASHRRSGTHLTIDAIVNNLPLFRKAPPISSVTLDHLSSHSGFALTPAELARRISLTPTVLKTHAHAHLKDFFMGDRDLRGYIKALFADGKIIYVHRDGRDVLVSLYHYETQLNPAIRQQTFSTYLRGLNSFDRQTYEDDLDRVAYWAFHVNSWLEYGDAMLVSYDDLRQDYAATLNRIATFAGVPLRSELRDIRRTPAQNKIVPRTKRYLKRLLGLERHSSVTFRRGVSGDWKQVFTAEDLSYFDQIAGRTNQRLGYL